MWHEIRKFFLLNKWYWIPVGLLLVLLGYVGLKAYYYLFYHGNAENVTFQGGDIQLAGVLVKPATPGPHPGIVLLHGSGPNRTYSKWHFRIHTNVFVRKGFAVLSYDKRGAGGSEGEHRTATFQDLVNDAAAAVAFLRSQSDVIADRVGLFGLSESGWFTPEIAATVGNIAFIVNRVSPPLPWMTTVLFEVKNDALAAGASETELEEVLTLTARIWQFYGDAAADESIANGSEREAINALLADMQKRPRVKDLFIRVLEEYDAELYAAWASKQSYDPYPFLTDIDVPMLYIMAGKDVIVPFDQSVALLERLKLELNKEITIKAYPQAGHSLLRWKLFPLQGAYVSGYLALIGTWAAEQIERK